MFFSRGSGLKPSSSVKANLTAEAWLGGVPNALRICARWYSNDRDLQEYFANASRLTFTSDAT